MLEQNFVPIAMNTSTKQYTQRDDANNKRNLLFDMNS